MITARRQINTEHGVALIAVLAVMLIVIGVISLFSVLAVGESRQARSDRQRAESLYWVQAAATQVQTQLRSLAVGPHQRVGTATTNNEFWRVPGSGKRQLTVQTPNGNERGFYEILAPVQGAPANSVAFARNRNDVQHRGEVSMLLRGSTDASGSSPRTVRVVFRRASLARYAVVSDAPIDAGNLGSSALRGSVHSNNVQGASVGVRLAGANTSNATMISATTGSISGSCSAQHCLPNSGRAVSFTDIDRAFAEVARLAARGGCTQRIACVVNERVTWHGANTTPAYRVRLDAGGGCINVSRMSYPVRLDAGTAAIVDDRKNPSGNLGNIRNYCPATGGMALLFNADVQLEGSLPSGMPPVTIMARNTAYPTVNVRGTASQRRQPASIYLVQRGSSIGSATSMTPVGIIAQGSVYLPEWAMTVANNRNLLLRNVAVAAQQGELSLGPMTLAMAGSMEGLSGGGTDARAGGGLNPCTSEASTFARAGRLRIQGAVASRRPPILSYGTSSSCSFGYSTRSYEYVDDLEWNPPPLYPTTSPWHIAAWDELAVTS